MGTPARNIALTPLVTPAPAPTALKPSASILSDTVPAPSVMPAVTPTHNPIGNGSRERTVIREREIVREVQLADKKKSYSRKKPETLVGCLLERSPEVSRMLWLRILLGV